MKYGDILPYQLNGVDFIKANEKCALWADMGLGKTIQTLTAYSELRESFDAKRLLVIGPLRVARKVWSDEVNNWDHLHDLRVRKIMGTPQQRWEQLNADADIHTVSRDMVEWLVAQFVSGGKKQFRKWPWDMVAVDEAQSFKNQSSWRHSAMRPLTRMASRVVELTGTPAANGYGDLWGQMYLLDRGQRLGSSEQAFKERWFNRPDNTEGWGKWTPKKGAMAEIQALVADIVLTMRECDYLDLPPIGYNTISVELPARVRAQYDALERDLLCELLDGRVITAANAGVVAQKLLQFANGSVYTGEGAEYVNLHTAKHEALLETIESVRGPCLHAYSYRSDLAEIGRHIKRAFGKKRRVEVLTSEKIEEEWNRGEIDDLLLHPESGGHGLNLHPSGSETILWFGVPGNREWYDQLNARLCGGHRRKGRKVKIHHLIAEGTYDENMMSLLKRKGDDQDGLKAALVARARERGIIR
jgi:SNF2 family DNA or RNA helicase